MDRSLLIARAAASAFIFSSFLAPARAATAAKKIKLDLYVMSLCPYGVQAENGVIPAVRSLSEFVELNLSFIGGQTPSPLGTPLFTALHGEPETAENIRQVCAMKLAPSKYMEYIMERNKGVKSPDWKGAASTAGLSSDLIAKIEECSKGPQGSAWYSKSIEASQNRGANSSPTIDIAGTPYKGGRDMPALTRALCNALKPALAAGASLPEVCTSKLLAAADEPAAANGGCAPGEQAAGNAAFDITVVTDSSCEVCAPTLLGNLALLHPKANIRKVDAGSKAGQELIKRYGSKTLPLYILDSKVEKDVEFSRLLPVAYYKFRDAYLIRHGPTNFFPSVWLERERRPRHLDVFLEGLAPVSIVAEQDLIRFFLEESKALGSLTVSLHFITHEESVPAKTEVPAQAGAPTRTASLAELAGEPGELTSPRGEAEIVQDVKQACLFQHVSLGIYAAFLTCSHKNLNDPESAQKCVPPESEAVYACIAGKEGREILRRDARLAAGLNIIRGPMFFWENRYGPFGWNETDWRGLLLGRKAAPVAPLPSQSKEPAGKTAKSAKQ